jgi:N-hydroxyarylamine O-acetyltransferase
VTVFDTSSLDLDAYLGRLGYDGRVSATLETLHALALAHPYAIPFENLDPLLGIPVPLDVVSLQSKLLRGGRGGWCFEHNVLLGTALRAIGFAVTGLAARVMWNAAAGATPPRSHMVLHVDLDGQPYIVDGGFGGLTLTAPLRLEAGVEQDTPHETFRLTAAADGFIVEARLRDDWKALYRFDLQRQAIADYEVSNWYLSTNPKSHFLSTLVAARVQPDRRYALRNTDFAIHHLDGYTDRRALLTARDLRNTLEGMFAIDVPTGPEVEVLFERIIASATSSGGV